MSKIEDAKVVAETTTPTDAEETLHVSISEKQIVLSRDGSAIALTPADAFTLTQQLAGYLPLALKAKLAAFLTATVAKTIG